MDSSRPRRLRGLTRRLLPCPWACAWQCQPRWQLHLLTTAGEHAALGPVLANWRFNLACKTQHHSQKHTHQLISLVNSEYSEYLYSEDKKCQIFHRCLRAQARFASEQIETFSGFAVHPGFERRCWAAMTFTLFMSCQLQR